MSSFTCILTSRNSIPPTTTVENLKTKAAMAKEEVFVDVGFWGGVIPGNEVGDLDDKYT